MTAGDIADCFQSDLAEAGALDCSIQILIDLSNLVVVGRRQRTAGVSDTDLDLLALLVQTCSYQLVASSSHQILSLGQVVAGDGAVGLFQSAVHSAVNPLNTVDIADSLHSLGRATVGGGGIVVDVVVVQLVHQRVAGLVAGSCGNPVLTIHSQGECLTEVVVGQNNGVLVALGLIHLLQSLHIGVEEEGVGVGLVNLTHLVGGGVVGHLVSGGSPLGQLALQECLLGSLVSHNVDDDLGGLVCLDLAAVYIVVSQSGQSAVCILGVLIVVLVLSEDNLLAVLQGLQLVGAVGHGSFNAGSIVGGLQAAGGIKALLVQILVYQPVGGTGSQEVVDVDSCLSNIADGVLVNLVAANGCIIGLGVLLVVVLVYLVVVNRVLAAGEQGAVLIPQTLTGNGVALISLCVYSCIINGDVLRNLVAGLILKALSAPQLPDVHIGLLAGSDLVGSGGNIHTLGQCIVVVVTTGNSGLTVVVQVCAVVHHSGIQQSLHGVDVGICIDRSAVLPLHVGVQLDLEYVALLGLLSSLTLGQSDLIFGQVVLVVLGYVSNGSCCLVNPLVLALFRVLNRHSYQGSFQVLHNSLVVVGLPSMGVPGHAQLNSVAAVGILCLSCAVTALRCISGVLLLAASDARKNHNHCQKQSQKLGDFLHSRFLLNICIPPAALTWLPMKHYTSLSPFGVVVRQRRTPVPSKKTQKSF